MSPLKRSNSCPNLLFPGEVIEAKICANNQIFTRKGFVVGETTIYNRETKQKVDAYILKNISKDSKANPIFSKRNWNADCCKEIIFKKTSVSFFLFVKNELGNEILGTIDLLKSISSEKKASSQYDEIDIECNQTKYMKRKPRMHISYIRALANKIYVGIGTRLVQFAFETSCNQGCGGNISLDAVDSHVFHYKMGFRVISENNKSIYKKIKQISYNVKNMTIEEFKKEGYPKTPIDEERMYLDCKAILVWKTQINRDPVSIKTLKSELANMTSLF